MVMFSRFALEYEGAMVRFRGGGVKWVTASSGSDIIRVVYPIAIGFVFVGWLLRDLFPLGPTHCGSTLPPRNSLD